MHSHYKSTVPLKPEVPSTQHTACGTIDHMNHTRPCRSRSLAWDNCNTDGCSLAFVGARTWAYAYPLGKGASFPCESTLPSDFSFFLSKKDARIIIFPAAWYASAMAYTPQSLLPSCCGSWHFDCQVWLHMVASFPQNSGQLVHLS